MGSVELIKDELSNQNHVERIACDKHFIDHVVQGDIPTTSMSTTLKTIETTTIVVDHDIVQGEIGEIPTTATTSTSTATTLNMIETTTIAPTVQKSDLHEPSLSAIRQLLIFACVILSVIFIIFVVKHSISMWLKIKSMRMDRYESNVSFVPDHRELTMKMHRLNDD